MSRQQEETSWREYYYTQDEVGVGKSFTQKTKARKILRENAQTQVMGGLSQDL